MKITGTVDGWNNFTGVFSVRTDNGGIELSAAGKIKDILIHAMNEKKRITIEIDISQDDDLSSTINQIVRRHKEALDMLAEDD